MSNEVARYEPGPIVAVSHERSIEELVAQAGKIKLAMDKAMEVDQHYGIIPGAKKPSLWKPGAEKLCLLFRLDPQYHSEPVAPDSGGGGHLTIKSVCTLWHIPTGQRFGSGEASCSTRESKYAYRIGKRACPICGAEAINKSKFPPKGKPADEPGWYCYAKAGGCGAEFPAQWHAIVSQETGRIANPDLADSYNTVLKMANKRALVAGILNVTAASDVFTQDLEDFGGGDDDEPEKPARPKAPAARPTPAKEPERPATYPEFTPAAHPIAPKPSLGMAQREIAEEENADREQQRLEEGEDTQLSEQMERSILLAQCKAAADKAKLSAGQRADILVKYEIRDPRAAALPALADMLAHLRTLVPVAK